MFLKILQQKTAPELFSHFPFRKTMRVCARIVVAHNYVHEPWSPFDHNLFYVSYSVLSCSQPSFIRLCLNIISGCRLHMSHRIIRERKKDDKTERLPRTCVRVWRISGRSSLPCCFCLALSCSPVISGEGLSMSKSRHGRPGTESQICAGSSSVFR